MKDTENSDRRALYSRMDHVLSEAGFTHSSPNNVCDYATGRPFMPAKNYHIDSTQMHQGLSVLRRCLSRSDEISSEAW